MNALVYDERLRFVPDHPMPERGKGKVSIRAESGFFLKRRKDRKGLYT